MDQDFPKPCQALGIPHFQRRKTEEPAQSTVVLPPQRAPSTKVFRCENQIDSSPQGSLADEEVVEKSDEESDLEIKEISEEVSRLGRRVRRLNQMLGTNIPECPSIDLCEQEHILFNMPDQIHPEILEIEIANNKLSTQLAQLQPLQKSANVATQMVRDVQGRDKKLGDQLQRDIQELDSFKLTFEKHQGLCLQRFLFVQRDKASGTEIAECSANRARFIQNLLNKQVVKDDYEPRRKEALKVMLHLKRASLNLQKHLTNVISHKKTELFHNL
ncbi:uncharacterized protein LOC108043676 [Drosophila rhopaloa]|uniref:Uncharacterized protein n=1 Tax=Drosophila rhopaloa TaxID=1041015 RepID=A0ABM5HC56_DRORH|nr:uncharacterized protein LOC108043676 [Drosophila rhopaloa]